MILKYKDYCGSAEKQPDGTWCGKLLYHPDICLLYDGEDIFELQHNFEVSIDFKGEDEEAISSS